MPKKRRSLNELKQEVLNGNYLAFLHSQYWKEKRPIILDRDHYECQRCLGKYVGKYGGPIKRVRITKATVVHHHIPHDENVELLLDDDNLVSLCWLCHEIVEGRVSSGRFRNKKKAITEERW